MHQDNQKWDGRERRAKAPQSEAWEIVEPEGGEGPIHHVTVPPQYHDEVVRRVMAGVRPQTL